jgi:hypothetical protein
MNALINRIAHHPVVSFPAFYVTAALARTDNSVAGAILLIAATSVFHVYRYLSRHSILRRTAAARRFELKAIAAKGESLDTIQVLLSEHE